MSTYKIFVVPLLCCAAMLHAEVRNSPILSFQSTYTLLESTSFDLQTASASAESTAGDVLQAQAIPNPNLIVGLSTIGNRHERDLDHCENELNVAVSQLVELGGKRSARVRQAISMQNASFWDIERRKNDLKAQLAHSFINVAAKYELLKASNKLHEISSQYADCFQSTQTIGKSSPLETKKAEIACRTAQLQKMKQELELKKVKGELLALSKTGLVDFERVDYALDEIAPLPPIEMLLEQLQGNAELCYAQTKLWEAWERIEVEKSKQVPDLAVQVGVATERFTRDPTLNVGFSIPLQIFDRNRGGLHKAICDYNALYYEEQKLEYNLQTALALKYEEWKSAYEIATAIKDSLYPQAQETYEMSLAAHKEGKFTYLELLDAETSLFNVKQQLIESAEDYHHKKVHVLSLTNQMSL